MWAVAVVSDVTMFLVVTSPAPMSSPNARRMHEMTSGDKCGAVLDSVVIKLFPKKIAKLRISKIKSWLGRRNRR
jgi:hypothetical protein